MTRGLQVTMSGEELKELISQRLQERTGRADALDARILEREGDQPYDVRPSDGLETLGELLEQRDGHRRRIFALRVLRDHVSPDEAMTLGAADLRAADLMEADPEPAHAGDGPIEYLRRPSTDGLKLTFSGVELHELLDERIESHRESAAWWQREAARTPEEQTEDAPLLPEEMCKNEAERHEWRVEVLSFIRSHTDQYDEYRIGASDLEWLNMQEISFTVHLFREGDVIVAHVPELDVSTCGDTAETARKNVKDAVRGFLEAAEELGTLPDVLEEAGYRREGEGWSPPEFVSLDRMAVGF